MKKNQGYYSWIHSLKQASVEAHFKGQEMRNLQEENKNKLAVSFSGTGAEDMEGLERTGAERTMLKRGRTPSTVSRGVQNPATLQSRRQRSLEDFEELYKQMKAEEGPRSSIPSAEEMFSAYTRAFAAKQAAAMNRPSDLTPSQLDVNGDGTVDGEDSAARNISLAARKTNAPAIRMSAAIEDVPPDSPLPTFGLAAQARAEHARKSYEEQRRAERIAAGHAAREAEHTADIEAGQDTIEGIVDRLMRGKK